MIGQRIKLYRLSKGWSIQQLVEMIEVCGQKISKNAISKFERNITNPSPSTLLNIAKALDIQPHKLLFQNKYNIKHLAFRKHSDLSAMDNERIKHLSQIALENYTRLIERIAPEQLDKPKFSRRKINNATEATEVAKEMRILWNLGNYPIKNLTLILEENGIFTLPLDEHEKFDGYSILLEDECCNVAIGLTAFNNNHTGERQRFSLAHELAHILFYSDDEKVNESLAHKFASAFLLPENEIKRIIGVHRRFLTLEELISYKKYFGSSIQAILYRLKDLSIISNNYYTEWMIQFSKANMRKNEPMQLEKETPEKIDILVKRAVSEGLITVQEAANDFGCEIAINTMPFVSKIQRFMSIPKDQRDTIIEQQLLMANTFYDNNTELRNFREAEVDD